MEWHPIETAPKDGTVVLVFPPTWKGKGRTASVAKWDDDKYAKKPRPYWSRDDALGQVTASRNTPPTHWMPMPPPPSNDTGNGPRQAQLAEGPR